MSAANIGHKAHVVFIEVQNAQAKKECVSGVAAYCFAQKMRLLFTVEDEMAAQYLDKLLWTFPLESMLPHGVGLQAGDDAVFITWQKGVNCNQAAVCFNLLADTAASLPLTSWVLELWDASHPERIARAEKRWQWYLDQGCHLQRYPWQRDLPLSVLQTKAV